MLIKCVIAFACASLLFAQPIAVQYQEGSVHGFLALHSMQGELLASGDLTQVAHGSRITSRLVFHFKDGSLDDDMSVFSDRGTFRLISDHHIQKGHMFPKPLDVVINAGSGKVTVRYEDNGKEKVETQKMDLPADLANGAIFDILKNISTEAGETKLSWLAATPKPRLVKLAITNAGRDSFSIAGAAHPSTKFRVKIEIGGLAGLVAPLIGKEPSDIDVWISDGSVPAFVKSEGALFFGGPLWRIEMTSPVW